MIGSGAFVLEEDVTKSVLLGTRGSAETPAESLAWLIDANLNGVALELQSLNSGDPSATRRESLTRVIHRLVVCVRDSARDKRLVPEIPPAHQMLSRQLRELASQCEPNSAGLLDDAAEMLERIEVGLIP